MIIERVIISGGGTGGHIFPAIAIADEIKKRNLEVKILFVGALGKMEMDKVPQASYPIVGLNISGFQRKITFSNLLLPLKLVLSLLKARKILKEFNPQIVVGVGGYASGPTLKMANMMGMKTVIQEQNSFPGKTNLLLSNKASCVFTAYEGMESFFLNSKVLLTGNPIRKEFSAMSNSKNDACLFYDLDPNKETILIMGGSLGAKTLNISVIQNLDKIVNSTFQIIWQCGKLYHDQLMDEFEVNKYPNIRLLKFIERMDLAYCAADIIISRAGALSVSELCVIGKPVILVPSPNVAEDHQTKNARALVKKNAALMVSDADAPEILFNMSFDLMNDLKKRSLLSTEIKKLQKLNATNDIVNEIEIILNSNEPK